jgi:hypothetical protein
MQTHATFSLHGWTTDNQSLLSLRRLISAFETVIWKNLRLRCLEHRSNQALAERQFELQTQEIPPVFKAVNLLINAAESGSNSHLPKDA